MYCIYILICVRHDPDATVLRAAVLWRFGKQTQTSGTFKNLRQRMEIKLTLLILTFLLALHSGCILLFYARNMKNHCPDFHESCCGCSWSPEDEFQWFCWPPTLFSSINTFSTFTQEASKEKIQIASKLSSHVPAPQRMISLTWVIWLWNCSFCGTKL